MQKIDVFVKRDAEIPNVARLIGYPEREIRQKFDDAQLEHRPCIFSTYVTEFQWDRIKQFQKGRMYP